MTLADFTEIQSLRRGPFDGNLFHAIRNYVLFLLPRHSKVGNFDYALVS